MLPPQPFVRGLLRNYATFLGFDPEVIIEEYEAETAPRKKGHSSDPTLSNDDESGLYLSGDGNTFPYDFNPAPQSSRRKRFPAFRLPGANPDEKAIAQLPPAHLTQVNNVLVPAPIEIPAADDASTTLPVAGPRTLTQRLGSTRLPELVALIAIAIALFGLGAVGLSRFTNLSPANPLGLQLRRFGQAPNY